MGTDGSYPCEYNIRNKSGESLGCTPASLDHTPEMSRTLSTVLKKKKRQEIEDSLSPKLCFIEDFVFGLIAFFGGKTPLSYGERK